MTVQAEWRAEGAGTHGLYVEGERVGQAVARPRTKWQTAWRGEVALEGRLAKFTGETVAGIKAAMMQHVEGEYA